MTDLADGFLWYIAFLLSTVLHEACHAFSAMKLGDKTAYYGGQVTLDPLPHIRREPVGTVIAPIFSFLIGGWMFGWASAPYDRDWARRNPDLSAWMSLAGPAANLALILISATLIHIGITLNLFNPPDAITFSHVVEATRPGLASSIAKLISIMFSLNLILFLFNLLPVPPLDGSGVIPLFLDSDRAVDYLDFIENPAFTFIGILIAWELFDLVFDPVHLLCINLLYPGVTYG